MSEDVMSDYTSEQLEWINHGARETAKKLLAIAQTGEHWGTFGGVEIKAVAQEILKLRRERDEAVANYRALENESGGAWPDAAVIVDARESED